MVAVALGGMEGELMGLSLVQGDWSLSASRASATTSSMMDFASSVEPPGR